jgi:hypothetical protein
MSINSGIVNYRNEDFENMLITSKACEEPHFWPMRLVRVFMCGVVRYRLMMHPARPLFSAAYFFSFGYSALLDSVQHNLK